MGQKDHAEAAGAGPGPLDPGPEYLHVAGAERQAGGGDGALAMEEQGEENWAGGEPDPRPPSLPSSDGGEGAWPQAKNTHQPLCRTQCVDLGTEGPPDLSSAEQPPPPEPTAADPPPPPESGGKEYRAKLEFALKLGYPEETVRLVLSKLGPDTLINDILGELVKLGSKSDGGGGGEQSSSAAAAPSASSSVASSSSSSSSSSCGCSDLLLDSQRSDSPCLSESDQDNLRPIVVDGSNVAMSHGNKEVFSCQGIQLAVDWFLDRGHHDITVFVPAWRKEQSRPDAPITDQEILRRLEKEKILVFTPSRRVQGRRVVCYDDRFIVKLAYESDGIIVSNDNYRDLANERPEWKKFIDERLLMYSFVNDKFMPPDDPLGRHGPSLDNFLRKRPVMPEQKKQPCPYGKKCTYGHKCKYYHPERGAQPQRAVADELRASAKTCGGSGSAKNQGDAGLVKSHSVPAGGADAKKGGAKRQSDPSVRALSYSDAEEKLLAKGRAEGHKSAAASPAPGGPPLVLGLPPECRAPHDPYEPPDLSYYSVTRAYSGLSLSARRSPDCRFDTAAAAVDLRPGSLGSAGSECGSESSASCGGSSCESYGERPCPGCPPNPLEDAAHLAGNVSRLFPSHEPLCALHHADYHSVYHVSRGHDPPLSLPPPSDAPPKRPPLYPLPPHLQHQPLAARSSCPGDYRSPAHAPGSPLGRCLAPARAESASDSHLYEHLTPSHHHHHHHPPHPHHRPKTLPSWDAYYRPPPPLSRYERSSYQSLPDARPPSWHAPPWAQGGYAPHHSSHPALHPSSTHYLNHPPHPAHPPPHPSSNPHPPYAPHHHPPSYLHSDCYGDAREKAYVNLCNIFPPELVSRVMARSPHLTDPQQLAAAILAEKAQTGY